MLICILIGTVLIGRLSADEKALREQAKAVLAALPKAFVNPDNPITPEKTALGKMLFYDTRLSVDGTVSCFKCHWVNLYLTDALPKSIGHHYKLNPRNAPSLFNAAGQIAKHWIGNRTSAEDQAKQSLVGPTSMGNPTYADAEQRMEEIPGYRPLFAKAFPGKAEPITADNFARAVAAWERTLVTPSRFDTFLAGDSMALNPAEREGLRVFIEDWLLGMPRRHRRGRRSVPQVRTDPTVLEPDARDDN